jgi:hypothetical protein
MKLKNLLLGCLILFCGTVSAQTVNLTGRVSGNKSPIYTSLTWSTSGATSCAASSSPVDSTWNGTVALSGSKTVGPIYTSTTYILTCSASGSNSASLNWSPPYYNTDGTVLTDLAGFKLYEVLSSGPVLLTTVAAIVNSAAINGLSAGTHTYYITAFNVKGVESSPSSQGSKIVGSTTSSKSLYVTVRK